MDHSFWHSLVGWHLLAQHLSWKRLEVRQSNVNQYQNDNKNYFIIFFFSSAKIKFMRLCFTYFDCTIIIQFGFIAMQQWNAIDEKRSFSFVGNEKITITS